MSFSDQFQAMETYIADLQNAICAGLESEDSKRFHEDRWEREEGGGGITRVLENGSVFEKGGVNISSVHGMLAADIAKHLQTEPNAFAACGLSLVIHPYSPKIPTIHMNVRYFEMANGDSWFGGGIDLTPYYPYPDDFTEFHRVLKQACDTAIPGIYPEYKRQCDDYFTLVHRGEMRGVGGIFYDRLNGSDAKHYQLTQAVGNAFLDAYLPLVRKRRQTPYNQDDKHFQLIRRGRYVEFNLIYDRGTLFGLKTNGRVESIFISMPPEVRFAYNWNPPPDSPQAVMAKYYRPYAWVE